MLLKRELTNLLALVVLPSTSSLGIGEVHTNEALSNDSNKRTRKSEDNGSADQAGAIYQSRRTQ
jgi:hypothetical protein